MTRTLVERYWQAQDPFDPAALATLRHPGWSAEWPQSGERIPSHEADVAIHGSYPGYPAHRLERTTGSDELWKPLPAPLLWAPVRITGASDIWIVEAHLEYPDDGRWLAIVSLELRDGLALRETVYFCRSFASPPWPDGFAEQAPAKLPAIVTSTEHNSEAEHRHRDAYQRYLDLAGTDPGAAARGLFHDTAEVDRPQSGRRVTGVEAIARAHDAQGDVLPGRIRRVLTSGHVLLAESRLDHLTKPWYLVSVAEFHDDKVVRMTEYLAESYAAPESRSAWVESLLVNG